MNNAQHGLVSVVIPTWNEEGWLARLLGYLGTYPEIGEIVIADNNSSDHTVEIAEGAGCKVTRGGIPGVARNRGASVCSGSIVLFLDADTVIPRSSLVMALNEFIRDPELAATSFRVRPLDNNGFARCGYAFADMYFRVCSWFGIRQGLGNAILVRSSRFHSSGGFDERVLVGEDVDLLRRMSRSRDGRVAYLRSCPVFTSTRRLKSENKVAFSLKVVVWTLVRLTGTSWSPISYKWSGYPASWGAVDAPKFEQVLKRLEMQR